MWMARKVEQQVQKSCGRGWFHHLNDALNVHPWYEKEGGALHGLGGALCSVCRASVIVEPQMLNTGVSPSSGWWR